MEQLTLRALDNPQVRRAPRRRTRTVAGRRVPGHEPDAARAVREARAHLAKRVIFVGDVKQAIYAFRGCDPELVDADAGRISNAAGARTDCAGVVVAFAAATARLPQSSCSFTRLRRTTSPAAVGVAAAAQRGARYAGGAAVANAGATDMQFDALARGIAKLVADRTRVIDPDTKQPRPVRFGDVAVLARTKRARRGRLRSRCKTARVPMKMSLDGAVQGSGGVSCKSLPASSDRSCRHAGNGRDRRASPIATLRRSGLRIGCAIVGSEGAVRTSGSTRRTPS